MSQNGNDLSVRQYKRYQCDLASAVKLDDADAAWLRFSPAASTSPRSVPVRVIDVSHGGLGLSSTVYIPPGTRLVVTFEAGGVEREYFVVARRVKMMDRTPRYYIGTAFSGTSPEQSARVEELLGMFDKAEGATRAERQ